MQSEHGILLHCAAVGVGWEHGRVKGDVREGLDWVEAKDGLQAAAAGDLRQAARASGMGATGTGA